MSYKGTPASSQIIWLEQRVEQLESGPGGIMEMKQTIADKEAEIDRLRNAYEKLGHMYNNLIAKNEYAKNEKIVLNWPENYGQGSEPWLTDVK